MRCSSSGVADARTGWAFVPRRSLEVTTRGSGRVTRYDVDAHGDRAPSVDFAEDAGAPTLVVAGESISVGQGLAWQDTFGARLGGSYRFPVGDAKLIGRAGVSYDALAAKEGWLREKAAGWRWLVRERTWLARRRRTLQAERRVADRELARLFAPQIRPAMLAAPPGLGALNALLAAWWRVVRVLL